MAACVGGIVGPVDYCAIVVLDSHSNSPVVGDAEKCIGRGDVEQGPAAAAASACAEFFHQKQACNYEGSPPLSRGP
eukprot:1032591-Rhodomonas_salina.2